MTTKHTPGPWAADFTIPRGSADGNWEVIEPTSDGLVASVVDGWDEGEPGQAEANAHLIAAAPDMLRELEETLRDLQEWDGSTDALEIIERNIAAAVAKAKAEQ